MLQILSYYFLTLKVCFNVIKIYKLQSQQKDYICKL
jgi:hypothetical protein